MSMLDNLNETNERIDQKLDKYNGLIELIAVLIIGISTVLGAFSAYQSSLYDGNSITKYNEGVALLNEANATYVYNNQVVMEDVLYWLHLREYRTLAQASSGDLAEKYQQLAQELQMVVPYELIQAIDWADKENKEKPFKEQVTFYNYQNYMDNLNKYPDKLVKKGNAIVQEGQRDNQIGDQQTLVTVIFAIVLFLGSMVSTVKRNLVRMIFFISMNIMFFYALYRLLQVPIIS